MHSVHDACAVWYKCNAKIYHKNSQKPKKRPSIQSDTQTNAKLKEVGLSSNQEGSRGVGLTLGANLQKHHPRTQLSTMTKISIEGPKWIPIKRFKKDIKSNTSP